MRPDLTGVVLAGGSSRRLGRPKEAVTLPDGRTLLTVAIELMSAVTRDVIVAGTPSVPVDIPVVADAAPGEGPLAALETVMQTQRAHRYLVLACDMPFMTAHALRSLAASDATLTAYRSPDGRLQPLPLLIDGVMSDRIAALVVSGARSLHRLFSEPEASIRDAEADVFANINTPDDLSQLA